MVTTINIHHGLTLLLSLHATQHRMTSPPSDPWEGAEGSRAPSSTSTLIGTGTLHSLRQDWEDSYPYLRTDTIYAPYCADKITPLDGYDWYGIPPSKYGSTRRVYGPTHYRMGARPWPWLSRLAKPLGTSTPQPRIEATGTTTSKGDRRPRSSYLVLYYHHDAIDRAGDDDKGHDKTMSCRTVDEPPPCQ
jgi:hypothetical protein